MIHYEIHFNFSTKEDLSFSAIRGRLLSSFSNLEGFVIDVSASVASLPNHSAPADPVDADRPADAGHDEDHTEPELAAPAVSDAPVVANDTPAGSADPSVAVSNISKEVLKEKLFELRDAKGADAVKALYEKCGNGAKTLKTLDESCYTEMYNQAVMLLAE